MRQLNSKFRVLPYALNMLETSMNCDSKYGNFSNGEEITSPFQSSEPNYPQNNSLPNTVPSFNYSRNFGLNSTPLDKNSISCLPTTHKSFENHKIVPKKEKFNVDYKHFLELAQTAGSIPHLSTCLMIELFDRDELKLDVNVRGISLPGQMPKKSLDPERVEIIRKFCMDQCDSSADKNENYINWLGWRKVNTKYCQLVSLKNRTLRYKFACLAMIYKETFDDFIFTDEVTIELRKETYKKWHKKNKIDVYRGKIGRARHNPKVHVWAGISRRGPTDAIIFEGRLNSEGFQKLLKKGLIPFIEEKYPDGHKLYMDNDAKHVSKSTKLFLKKFRINHFLSPAQSPDMNPIENIWNDLKYFLCTKFKPTN
ncbi:unnamed protein product [Brachionus calyciflorus]|uniref:Tc1-like transposase DDE domain-containing protein n=1 Tax=Brachionus calyciflorus TaxID=104777 RepID=A0A813NGV1_9BILA|nr:unnamed protein product [Brachionus calyciflorus]